MNLLNLQEMYKICIFMYNISTLLVFPLFKTITFINVKR
jgi:hypothetical protein